jgi:hypothetical protein
MAKLSKFTLSHNKQKDTWDLKRDTTVRVIKKFDSKGEATKGGALKRAVGADGGSVKIKTENGKIQEERTYPRAKDPRRSKG